MSDKRPPLEISRFANDLLGDWDSAMDQFFTRVDRKARERKLTDEQVRQAMQIGYDLLDAWDEWIGEES